MREGRSPFKLTNRMYGGTIILNGTHDTSPVWRGHLVPDAPFVHGNLRTGRMDYEDAFPNPIAYVAQNMTVQPFAFVAGGDPYYTAHVPTRNTTIGVWAHSSYDSIVNDAIKLMLNLNLNRDTMQTNYANLVQQRVFDRIPGYWTMAMGYFSNKPKLLLSARGAALYIWLTYFNGVYALTYSTDPMLMEKARAIVPEHMVNEFFYYPLILNNSSLVIAPTYLISKFSKMLHEMPGPASRLVVISYMKNYLERIVTHYEGPNTNEDRREAAAGSYQEGIGDGGD